MNFRVKLLSVAAYGLMAVLGFDASAQQTLSIGYEKPNSANQIPLNLRSPSQNEIPIVKAGLQAEKFTKLSANIRGMAVLENGDILVLDQKRGRITVLTDRAKDGRIDMRKTLPIQFNNPVSLTVFEDLIYVADQEAVWVISGMEKRALASLQNIRALPDNRPILIAPDTQYLYLGLSQSDDQSQVVAIDRMTGQAQSVAQGKGEIKSLAQVKGTALWLSIDHKLVPVQGKTYDYSLGASLPEHISVDHVYLPAREDMSAPGLGALAGKFLVAMGQDYYGAKQAQSGRQIMAFGSAFGQPDGEPISVMSGFMANHGRSAWGQPGHMVWDERGLFVADKQSGIIWKVSQLVPKIRMVESPKKDIKFYKSDEKKKPKAKWGSSIEQASTIVSGSLLGKNWEDSSLIPKETLMEKLRREDKEKAEKKD